MSATAGEWDERQLTTLSKVLEKKTRNPNKRAHQSFYDVVHQKVFEDMKKMPTQALKE